MWNTQYYMEALLGYIELLLILHLCLILRFPSTSTFNSPFEQISLIQTHTHTHTSNTHSPTHHTHTLQSTVMHTHTHTDTHVHSHPHISLISCSYLPMTHPKWIREWGTFLFPQWRGNKNHFIATRTHTHTHARHTHSSQVKRLSIFNDAQTAWPSIAGLCGLWCFVPVWEKCVFCLCVHPK